MAQYDLKRLRKEKGITQQGLAKALNITQGYLSSIESGRNTFPDDKVDELQALFQDIRLEDYENEGAPKIEIGNHNTASDIRICDPNTMSSFMAMVSAAFQNKQKDRSENEDELVKLKARNEKLADRNDKLADRYDRMVDELEEMRKKLREAKEEIDSLKKRLAEFEKK